MLCISMLKCTWLWCSYNLNFSLSDTSYLSLNSIIREKPPRSRPSPPGVPVPAYILNVYRFWQQTQLRKCHTATLYIYTALCIRSTTSSGIVSDWWLRSMVAVFDPGNYTKVMEHLCSNTQWRIYITDGQAINCSDSEWFCLLMYFSAICCFSWCLFLLHISIRRWIVNLQLSLIDREAPSATATGEGRSRGGSVSPETGSSLVTRLLYDTVASYATGDRAPHRELFRASSHKNNWPWWANLFN